jgi:hypothetical protein
MVTHNTVEQFVGDPVGVFRRDVPLFVEHCEAVATEIDVKLRWLGEQARRGLSFLSGALPGRHVAIPGHPQLGCNRNVTVWAELRLRCFSQRRRIIFIGRAARRTSRRPVLQISIFCGSAHAVGRRSP